VRVLLRASVGLREEHVIAAPLQHLGRGRLMLVAHLTVHHPLLRALTGSLVDLSHTFITTVSAGFVPDIATRPARVLLASGATDEGIQVGAVQTHGGEPSHSRRVERMCEHGGSLPT
jgi:hypothetical protein